MTSKPTKVERRAPELSSDSVAAYLRRHPDFLATHPDLLDALYPDQPRRTDGAIDFQGFLVEKLRADLEQSQTREGGLLESGRANLVGQRRIHDAVLAVLGAADFAHLIELIITDLAIMLDADVAALGVEKCAGTTQPDGRHGITLLEPGHVAALFGDGRDIILCADDAPDIAIFEGAAPLVQSAAYMRLTVGGGAPPALFALGSRFEGTFGANHGAELLSFLARILERCIGTWLNLPGPRAIPLIPR